MQLAYFGTDQSQVQRYLSGASLTESRLGPPVQRHPQDADAVRASSLVGVLVFVFYQFHQPPIFFNQPELARAEASARGRELRDVEAQFAASYTTRAASAAPRSSTRATPAIGARSAAAERTLRDEAAHADALRKRAMELIGQSRARAETKDPDYIFLRFVLAEFPSGLVGLLIAVILCAAMSATASALNSLGTTSVVDFYKRSVRAGADDAHYLRVAKLFTVFWGAVAVAFAIVASLLRQPDPGGEHPRAPSSTGRCSACSWSASSRKQAKRNGRVRRGRGGTSSGRGGVAGIVDRISLVQRRRLRRGRRSRARLVAAQPSTSPMTLPSRSRNSPMMTGPVQAVRGSTVCAPSVCALSSVAVMSDTCT